MASLFCSGVVCWSTMTIFLVLPFPSLQRIALTQQTPRVQRVKRERDLTGSSLDALFRALILFLPPSPSTIQVGA